MPGELAYAATSGAVEAFSRSLSAEVDKLGITVNAVDPGPTDTGWIPRNLPDKWKAEAPRRAWARPRCRSADPIPWFGRSSGSPVKLFTLAAGCSIRLSSPWRRQKIWFKRLFWLQLALHEKCQLPIDRLTELWPRQLRSADRSRAAPCVGIGDARHSARIFEQYSGDLFRLAALFGPQHGYLGQTQDNMIEWEGYRHRDWEFRFTADRP